MVLATIKSGGGVISVEILEYPEDNPYEVVEVEYVGDRRFGADYIDMNRLLDIWEE